MGTSPDGAWSYGNLGQFTSFDSEWAPVHWIDGLYGDRVCADLRASVLLDEQGLIRIPGGERVFNLEHGLCAFSPLDKTFFAIHGRQLVHWSEDGRFLGSFQFDWSPYAIAISPNGRIVAVAKVQTIYLIDADSLAGISEIPIPFVVSGGGIPVISWDPMSSRIAYSLGETRFTVVNVSTSQNESVYGFSTGVESIAWSRTDSLMAVGTTGGRIHLIDADGLLQRGNSRPTLDGSKVASLIWAADGSLIAGTAGGDVERWSPSDDPVRADAGPDMVVRFGDVVTLDGSASSAVAAITSYSWEVSGPEERGLSGRVVTFRPAYVSPYNVVLRVVDELGNVASDSVSVTVFGSDDQPPRILIRSPFPNEQIDGDLVVIGNGTDDSGSFWVSLAVDGGSPVVVHAESEWSIRIGGLRSGYHIAAIDSFDLYQHSGAVSFGVWINATPPPDRGLPDVQVREPRSGTEVHGVVVVSGTSTGPDLIEAVTVATRFESNLALGTVEWIFALNTSRLPDGANEIVITAQDTNGDEASKTLLLIVHNTGRLPTAAPSIEILGPTREAIVGPTNVNVSGRVTDDGDLLLVQIRIGESEWRSATVSSDGSFNAKLDITSWGWQDVEARAFDGWSASATSISVFVPGNGDGSVLGAGQGGGLFWVALLLVGIILVAAILIRQRNREWTGSQRRFLAIASVILVIGAFSVLVSGPAPMSQSSPDGGAATQDGDGLLGVEPSVDVACLARGDHVLTSEDLNGAPAVLVVSALRWQEATTMETLDSHRLDFPPGTMFVVVYVPPVFNRSSEDASLQPLSIRWQPCEDTYGVLLDQGLGPNSIVMIGSDGHVSWTGYGQNAHDWIPAIQNLH